jgi:ABC-type lipoprotein release transport system permease subunit
VRRAESPVRLVARAQVRSRRRSLLALGLLAGLTAGVVVASLSGAVRTGTALDRLRVAENAPDAILFPSQADAYQPDWEPLRSRPEVETLAVWSLLFGVVGEGGPPGAPPGPTLLFASVDGTYLGELGRPLVTEGRMYDPEAADEIVIDENIEGIEVGDVIPFQSYGADQLTDTGEATGPSVDFRVVGRVKTLAQFLFVADGQALVSPGFLAAHGDEVQSVENADVKLRHGAADVDTVEDHANEDLAPGTPVLDLHSTARRVETTTSVERTALFALAGVVLLAGIALVGQALTQSAAASVDDLRTLRAIGMTRPEVVAVATRSHLPAAMAAAVTATATALIASRWFPIGIAGRIDPDRGLQVTWWLMVPGALLASLGLLAAVAWASRSDTRAVNATTKGSRPVSWVRGNAPVPVGVGVTMALSSGRGRSRVPVRQALIGAVAGVLGVVATLTLGAGLEDALDHPERAGVAWDAAGHPIGEDMTARGIRDELTTSLEGLDGVDALAVVDRQVLAVGGVGTPGFSVRSLDGQPDPGNDLVVTEGRAPADPDEVALGPRTADRLDLAIGDSTTVGEEGAPERTVVGIALFPSDVHAAFDEGVWLTPEAFDELTPPFDLETQTGPERGVVVRLDDGVDPDDGVEAINAVVGDHFEDMSTADIPVELTNLGNVRRLPNVLAGFLVLLAVSALGHVLATSARRRRQEFAVLRALGLGRGGARAVLNVQGTVIGAVGLIVGVPVGIVVGRVAWGLVAETVPLEVVRPVAAAAVVVLIPVALIVANGLAIWPGHRVARLRPAEVLRSE